MSYFGRQRSMSLRRASMPAASILAHCAGVSRIERCSSFASGGVGGLPRGRFGSSMRGLSVIQKVLAIFDLLNHNKAIETHHPESNMTNLQVGQQVQGISFDAAFNGKIIEKRCLTVKTDGACEFYIETAEGNRIVYCLTNGAPSRYTKGSDRLWIA